MMARRAPPRDYRQLRPFVLPSRFASDGSYDYMTSVNCLKRQVMAAAAVRDNKAQKRFELEVEGGLAFANYRLTPTAVIITHTETPRALRGRGIGSELVQ